MIKLRVKTKAVKPDRLYIYIIHHNSIAVASSMSFAFPGYHQLWIITDIIDVIVEHAFCILCLLSEKNTTTTVTQLPIQSRHHWAIHFSTPQAKAWLLYVVDQINRKFHETCPRFWSALLGLIKTRPSVFSCKLFAIFSKGLSLMKIYEFWFIFHWNLFPGFHLATF